MANLINNAGKWGPIEEGSGAITQKAYHGRQITLDFDGSDTTSTLYTGTFKAPISTDSIFIWNTETVDCATATDVEVFWQGTADPSAAAVEYGGRDQQGVSGTDTGWAEISLLNMEGSEACDARSVVVISKPANITFAPYMRLKFVLTAASPGDVDIICRIVGIPAIGKATHSLAL